MPGNISNEYRRWWAKLSQKERNTLVASGTFKADALDNPERALHDSRVDQDKFDFSELVSDEGSNIGGAHRVRSTDFISPATIDQVTSNEADAIPPDPRIAELDLASFRLRGMLHFLLESLDKSSDPEMPLTAQIIRIVVGEGCPPKMTALAKQYGMTRAAVSLRCCKLLRRLGLEPSRFMRPEAEVHAMRVARIVSVHRVELDEHTARVKEKNRRVPIRNRSDAFASKNGEKPRISLVSSGYTPGKESFTDGRSGSTRSRPRKNDAKTRSFCKGQRERGEESSAG